MRSGILLCLLFTTVFGGGGFGPTEQNYGFVNIREDAHMFWWLHFTTAATALPRPLVVWLQGGPGASSTGFGYFGEIGPLDAHLKPRNTTWVKDVNLLLVDNPVGTGYSYVDKLSALATNNRQIAEDFLVLMKGFYKLNPDFIKTPLYIFCESYGGKMTAEIALVMQEAIHRGELDANFKGVGLGDSWISPIDSVLTWAPFLLQLGAIDQLGYRRINGAAEATKKALAAGDFEEATNLWGMAESIVFDVTDGIDFYNVLTKISSGSKTNLRQSPLTYKPALVQDDTDSRIEDLMNNEVKAALGINGTWGEQSGNVFDALAGDFMKPVTDIVELLLNTTDLKVAVYNGQLDLIVDTPGTITWVDNLKWTGSEDWRVASRDGFAVNGIYEGYRKKVDNLSFYWVNRAGHMVPLDNPAAMDYILRQITNDYNGK